MAREKNMSHEFEPNAEEFLVEIRKDVISHAKKRLEAIIRLHRAHELMVHEEGFGDLIREKYSVVSPADAAVPSDHVRIMFEPVKGREQISRVPRMIVRIPFIDDTDPKTNTIQRHYADDVFLEVSHPSADVPPSRFLLNENGLEAYDTADDISPDIASLDNPESTHMYRVIDYTETGPEIEPNSQEGYESGNPITEGRLLIMAHDIISQYKPVAQSNLEPGTH